MWFEDFQEGRNGGHLGTRNRTILAILNLYIAPMPPVKFRPEINFNSLIVWEMSFEEFQDGCRGDHLGYRNVTILAILKLHVPHASHRFSA